MADEILKMNEVQIKEKAVDLKRKIAEARFDKATGKLIDTAKPKRLRRELARALTRQSQLKAR